MSRRHHVTPEDLETMIATLTAAVLALASPTPAPNANATNITPMPAVAIQKREAKTLAGNPLPPVPAAQAYRPFDLDPHIRPIDPAGDLQAQLLELSG
jgi:hypothetical protein